MTEIPRERERGESGRRGDAREFSREGDDGGIENARGKGKFVGEVEHEGNLKGGWRSVRRKRRRMAPNELKLGLIISLLCVLIHAIHL